MATLGEALKKARCMAGLSRFEAALKIGVAPRSIARWENNEREPGFKMLCVIAKCYAIKLPSLIEMIDYVD